VHPHLKVALVGPEFQENLGLEYLAAAAQSAGHHPKLMAYGSRTSAPRVVAEILADEPILVGLSIAFQASLSDSLYLAEALRSAGFAGHITCGGHVPTFEYAALLRDCPALDSAVRHDGEHTLLELLDRLARGESLRGVAGLVWRNNEALEIEPPRAPSRDLDELPLPARPEPPRQFAGIPMSFVIGSRGCVGDCAYCCIRAYARQASGPALRLRQPEAIGREIAELTQRAPSSAIFFEDDLFVLPSERRTIERMAEIRRSMTDHGAKRCAFWAKGQPDAITPPVVEAAKSLGIIHLFLGIENHVPERLRYLGRSHSPQHNQYALELLSEMGLGASFNLMLFDPDCGLQDVARNLDFAEAHLDLPWNLCRTELYSGTELLRRVSAEGRLLGDYRSYGYVMRDPRAELMFRVLRVCFRQRAFDATSLLNHVISLCYGVQMHQQLIAGQDSEALAVKIRDVAIEVHRDTVDTLRRILDFAQHAELEDAEGARRYAVALGFDVNGRDLAWRRSCDQFSRLLAARGRAATGLA
jgi:anaerobic magnesium-protoporphyrin IX monomethyl ester cyclase